VPRFIYELRSFNDIFSSVSLDQKEMIFYRGGLRNYFEKDELPILSPNPDSGIDILSGVMMKRPSHLVEVLVVVPHGKTEIELLDIYNALGRIEKIKESPLYLADGREYYIFSETNRITSRRDRRPIPDPPPSDMLPPSETMYLSFTEVHLGNFILRGDIIMSLYGITYSITNITDIRYFLLPVMRAERFTIALYLEPVKEGVLIYCMSGYYIPGFIASRVNLTVNVHNRITLLLNWITSGLRK